MLTLHRSLRHLGRCASPAAVMHALSGVHVKQMGDRSVVTASDGKALVQADAPSIAGDFPTVPGFDANANGSTSAIIPADRFTSIFSKVGKSRRAPEATRHAAVTLEDGKATFAAVRGSKSRVMSAKPLDGKFPDSDLLFSRNQPTVTIYINARLMSDTLRVMADMLEDADGVDAYPVVRMDLFDPKAAIQIWGGSEEASCGKISALVMPMDGRAYNIKRWKCGD